MTSFRPPSAHVRRQSMWRQPAHRHMLCANGLRGSVFDRWNGDGRNDFRKAPADELNSRSTAVHGWTTADVLAPSAGFAARPYGRLERLQAAGVRGLSRPPHHGTP